MKKALVSAVTASVALSVLVGCGAGNGVSASRFGSLENADVTAPVYRAAPIVTTGSVEVSLADTYSTQATAADVKAIKVTVVPAGGQPVSKTVAKGQTALIDGLAAGKAGITVDALDGANNLIGTVSKADIDIVAGQTTIVKLSLKLNPTIVAPSTGGLGVDVTLVDGDVIASPTPTPGPTATPAPTPAPTQPPAAGAFGDGFESGFGNWSASFEKASYSSVATPSSNWNASAFFPKTGAAAANPGDGTGAVKEPGTYRMTLAGAVNTGGSAAPKLDFDFAKFTSKYYFKSGAFAVQASTNNGANWTQVWAATADQAGWAHVTANLPQAAAVKVRFAFTYDYYLGTDAFGAPVVDNVAIQ